MKIYFAGSIRAGRSDQELYQKLIRGLKHYGRVLTEHVGDASRLWLKQMTGRCEAIQLAIIPAERNNRPNWSFTDKLKNLTATRKVCRLSWRRPHPAPPGKVTPLPTTTVACSRLSTLTA